MLESNIITNVWLYIIVQITNTYLILTLSKLSFIFTNILGFFKGGRSESFF